MVAACKSAVRRAAVVVAAFGRRRLVSRRVPGADSPCLAEEATEADKQAVAGSPAAEARAVAGCLWAAGAVRANPSR